MDNLIPLAIIKSRDANKLFLFRNADRQTFEIAFINNAKFSVLGLPKELTTSYPVHVNLTDNGKLVLISYFADNKLVMGQSLSASTENLNVWEIDIKDMRIRKIGTVEGGLTSEMVSVATRDSLFFCQISNCFLYKYSKLSKVKIPEVQPIEIIANNGLFYFLARKPNDDRIHELKDFAYSICTVSSNRLVGCNVIRKAGVPRLDSSKLGSEDSPGYLLANSSRDRHELLMSDLHRLFQMFLGTSNAEGRIAWQATYAIEGLQVILQSQYLSESELSNIDFFVNNYIEWLSDEILLDISILESKRYSLNRRPILSILHLSRIFNMLNQSRAKQANVLKAKEKLLEFMKSNERTLEEYVDDNGQLFMQHKIWSACLV
jgi:hypothetical protein